MDNSKDLVEKWLKINKVTKLFSSAKSDIFKQGLSIDNKINQSKKLKSIQIKSKYNWKYILNTKKDDSLSVQ